MTDSPSLAIRNPYPKNLRVLPIVSKDKIVKGRCLMQPDIMTRVRIGNMGNIAAMMRD